MLLPCMYNFLSTSQSSLYIPSSYSILFSVDVQEVFKLLPRKLSVTVDVVAREDGVHLGENLKSDIRQNTGNIHTYTG